jgi:hypothetical protein
LAQLEVASVMGGLIAECRRVQRVSGCVLRCHQSVSTYAGFTGQCDASRTSFGSVRSGQDTRSLDPQHDDQLEQIGSVILCKLATASDGATLSGAASSKDRQQRSIRVRTASGSDRIPKIRNCPA